MKLPISKPAQFVLHAFVPVLCSIVLGYIFFGQEVFNRLHPTFQFVITPVIASVFYFLLVLGSQRNAYAGLIVLFFLTLLTTQSTTVIYILRDVFYVAAIATAVLAYFKHFKRADQINFLYAPITMAGLYAVIYILAQEFHVAVLQASGVDAAREAAASPPAFFAFFGVAIGFAVGGGIALGDKVFGTLTANQEKGVGVLA
jgi:hypothetical protein